MCMEEIWKEIDGFPDYQVSTLGRVKGPNSTKSGYLSIHTTPSKGGMSYQRVRVREKTFSVHRLVAKAFLPNPDNLPTVDHIDGNENNNTVNNLRWASYGLQRVNQKDRSNHKYIEKYKDKNSWRVAIMREGRYIIKKSFPSLEEAIKTRDDFLQVYLAP